jgi:hypothetical protein
MLHSVSDGKTIYEGMLNFDHYFKENNYESMLYSGFDENRNNPDSMQNSSIRINYECIQKEIQSVKGFKIAHLNIIFRSLIKHIDEFRIFLRN